MVGFVTAIYLVVAYGFLLSFLLFFLQTELDPLASQLGGVGIVGSLILGIGVLTVFGPPPNLSRLSLWFVGGFVFVSGLIIFLHVVRWAVMGR